MSTKLYDRTSGLVQAGSGVTQGVGTAGTGVTAGETGDDAIHRTVLTLADVSVTVGNTTGVSFGGTKVYDFPEGRILLLGAVASGLSLDFTDAGNVTPIDGTMGGDFAFGTTVAGDGTLSGTDVDIIPSTSWDPFSGTPSAALAAAAQFDGTSTAKDVFLNMLVDDADVADTASDVLLVSGTLTLLWSNIGDY